MTTPLSPVSYVEKEGYFRFNDLVFDVPPTDIAIAHRNAIKESSYLRSRHSTKTKTGRGIVSIGVTLIILPEELWKLHRLIQQFKYTPFWEVENNYVRSAMLPGTQDSPSMAVCAESMSITTIEDNPHALSVQLGLSWFNYAPFGSGLNFKKDWKFQKSDGSMVTLFDISSEKETSSVPSDFPVPKTDEPLEIIQKAQFMEYTDVTPPIVQHLPTEAVSADESNVYAMYLNWIQARAMEQDFDTYGALNEATGRDPKQPLSGNIEPKPYAHSKFFASENVVFNYKEYKRLSPSTDLAKLLDKSFTRLRQNASSYAPDSVTRDGRNSSVVGTGSISGPSGKVYRNVGTAMVCTNGVGRVASSVGYRNSTSTGGSSNHKGTDIGWSGTSQSGEGIPIYSPIDGQVVYSTRDTGRHSSSFGGYLIIKGEGDHDGLFVRQGHMSNNGLLITGQKISRGQSIGNAGTTPQERGGGTSTHPIHHHVELWENGAPAPQRGGTPRLMDIENVQPQLSSEVGTLLNESDQVDVSDVQDNKQFKYEAPTQAERDAARIEVEQYEREGWHLYNSPHVPPTLYRNRILVVPSTRMEEDGLLAAVWGVEMVNRFAHVPIISHEYPTSQYMGGQEGRVFFQFLDLNTRKRVDNTSDDGRLDGLSVQALRLFEMRNVLERNARDFKTIPGSWAVEMEFLGANLAGSKSWVVSSMGSNSIPGSPGLYQIQLELDASAPFQPALLEGISYNKDELFRSFRDELKEWYNVKGQADRMPDEDWVINQDGESVKRPFGTKTGKWNVSFHNTVTDPDDSFLRNTVDFIGLYLLLGSHCLSDKWYGGLGLVEIPDEFDAWGFEEDLLPMFGNNWVTRTNLDDPLSNVFLHYPKYTAWWDSLFNNSDFARSDITKGTFNKQIETVWQQYDLLTRNKYGTRGIEGPVGAYDRRTSSGFEESEEVISELSRLRTASIRARQTPNNFNPGRPLTREETLRLQYTHSSPELEAAIFEDWKEVFAAILTQAIAGAVDRNHRFFQKTIELARKSAYANMPSTYPDLLLPSHPIMQSPIMTFPDFYFYNESEDGDVDDLSDTQWKEQLETCVKNTWGSMRDFTSGKKFQEEFDISDAPKNEAMDGANFGSNPYKSAKNSTASSAVQDFMAAESGFVDPTTGRLASKTSGAYGGNKNTDHLFGEAAVQQLALEGASDLINEKFFLMRRAFPTFKLEFVDDNGTEGWRSLSDFYGYSAIKRITCTRSRKIPADLVIIELQNVGGVLDGTIPNGLRDIDYVGRETQNGALTGRAKEADRRKSNQSEDHLFDSIVLREGMDIRLRLGYANNAEYMENLFNGRVLQVSWDDNNDHVSVMAQAYTTEMIAVEKGVTGERLEGNTVMDNPTLSRSVGYVDTAELLNSMLKSPEILHFGRFTFGALFQQGEAQQADFSFSDDTSRNKKNRATIHTHPNRWKALWRGVGGMLGSITAIPTLGLIGDVNFGENLSDISDSDFPILGWGRGKLEFKYKFREVFNNPVDDNVFAPSADDLIDWGIHDKTGNVNKNDISYYPVNTTVWDIFQEMTLRHPGWIASPVPYGRRMTMFFGVPSQRYWSKPVPDGYKLRMQQLRSEIEKLIETNSSNTVVAKDGIDGEELAGLVTEYIQGLSARFRPFRRYHMASSRHNIVGNNMAVSSYGVWNAVSVTYTKSGKADKKAEKRKKKKIKGASWWKTLEMKAHSQMPDEDVLAESIDYFNCNGEPLAKRYGVGSIMRGLKDMYKGSLTLIGNARIKPYDIIMISDDYNGIAGPVEVEEVTHIFTPENGFISVITPDAVVIANEASSFPVLTGLAGGAFLNLTRKRFRGAPLTSVAVGIVGGGASLATGSLENELQNREEKALTAIEAAASVYEPKVVDTWLNMYNYWYWAKQEIAINLVPLMKDGEPWVAGVPEDLFNTQWDNFQGLAKSTIGNARRGRLATIISSQLHGYQVSAAYDGDMTLNQKWRADKLTSQ